MSRGLVAFPRSGGSTRRGMPSPLLTPFLALYHDMNRLLLDDASGASGGAAGAANQSGATILVPDINIAETEREIRVTVEVPGAREADVEVLVDDDTLVVRAVKETER